MKNRFALLFSVSVLASNAWLAPAVAQETAENPDSEHLKLDVITVSAQKREERSIDVPMSLVATSGDDLDTRNLINTSDLQYLMPGFQLPGSNTPRGAGVSIRGIGTQVFADGIEQSVGTVVDGVPLARAGQGLADLVDIERVEVLRGPQGTLFGRNASAGLINIITKRPTEEFALDANFRFGTDGYRTSAGAISGAIVPSKVAGRLSVHSNERDPIVNRVGEEADLNGQNEIGVRASLLFTPSENLEVLLRADWSERDTKCCIWTPRTFASAATDPRPGILFLEPYLTGVTPSESNRTIGQAADTQFNHTISEGASGEINWSIGDYTVTSITGVRAWRQKDASESDLTYLDVLDINSGSNHLEQFSQELRLTSPQGRQLEYVLGAFYYDSTNRGRFEQIGRFALSLAVMQDLGIDLTLAPGLVLPADHDFGRTIHTVIDVEDAALFGQASYQVSDSLSLFAGGRYNSTTVGMDYSRIGTPGASAYNFIVGAAFSPLAFTAETSDQNFSWRAGGQYQLTPDANLYLTAGRGYKGPGYNNLLDIVLPAGVSGQDFTKVDPEIPTSIEIGYKAALLDNVLRVELSAFRSEFKDFQAQVVEQSPGSPIGSFSIKNAGKLITQGVEAQVSAAPAEGLTLGASFAYIDAKFDSFKGASCPRDAAAITTVGAPCGPFSAGGPNAISFDASGQKAPGTPELAFNLDGRYEWQLRHATTAFVQANYSWRDDVTFGLYPQNIPNPTTQEAYGILDASAGVVLNDGAITLSVFGRNLTDQHFVARILGTPFDGIGGYSNYPSADADRLVGIGLRLSY